MPINNPNASLGVAVFHWSGRFPLTGATNVTLYCQPGGNHGSTNMGSGALTETFLVPRSGTIRNLYVWSSNALTAGQPIDFTVVVNGTPSAVTCTVAGGSDNAHDAVNTVAVSAGDRVILRVHSTSIQTANEDFLACFELE